MTDQEKRIYNQENYRKNREIILERVKAKYVPRKPRSLNVIPMFTIKSKGPDRPERRKNKTPRLCWGTIFLLVFVAAMTGFLVNETAQYYASVDGTLAAGYLKAVILEGAVFSFALMKARSAFTGTIYRLMILLVYAYSAWAISSSVISNAFNQHSKIVFNQKSVAELEAEVMEKVKLRASLVDAKRLTLSHKLDQVLTELKGKLGDGRRSLLSLPASTVLWNTLLSLVVFRVLVMFTNLLCIRELRRRYCMKSRTV